MEEAGRVMTGFTEEIRQLNTRINAARAHTSLDDELRNVLLEGLETAHEELRVADEEIRSQSEELNRLVERQRLGMWQHDRLLAVLPVPVIVTDVHGRIHTVNAAAAAFLQVGVDRIIRKPLQSFIDPADRGELRGRLSEAVSNQSELRMSVSLTSRQAKADPIRAELVASVGYDETAAGTQVTWLVMIGDSATTPDTAGSANLPVARAVAQLAELPLHALDDRETMRRVAVICETALGSGVAVTVTVGEPAEPETLVSTAEDAQRIDGAQMIANEGPCQSAWETGEPVVSEDLKNDERWPRLKGRIEGVGIESALAIPMRMGDDLMGVLNVYLHPEHPIEDTTRESAELLGAAVGAILHEIEIKRSLEALALQFKAAMDTRAPIEQAKGLIMAATGCTADQAFELLRSRSNKENVKVRDLAARMVSSNQRPRR